MKLEKIILNNFQSFQNAEIDFENLKIVSITGKYKNEELRSNGSGKSTILDSIAYAIFGKSRTKEEGDLIRENTDEMNVELYFSLHNNEKIIINRGKTKKGNYLNLKINDIDKTTGKIETQEIIENKIGMDFDLFIATLFFQQEGSDKFTAATPTERKKYLKKLLNLEIYDRAYKLNNEKIKSLNEEIIKINSKLEFINDQIKDVNIKDLTKSLEICEKELIENQKKLKEKNEIKSEIEKKQILLNSLKNDKEKKESLLFERSQSLDTIEKKLNKEKEELKIIQNKLENIKKIPEEELNNLKEIGENLSTEIGKLQSNVEFNNQQIKNLKNKKSNISKEKLCPFCDNNLDENYKEKFYKNIDKQIEDINKNNGKFIKELEIKKVEINNTRESYKKNKEKINEYNELNKYENIGLNNLKNYEKNKIDIEKQIKNINQEIKEINKNIKLNKIDKEIDFSEIDVLQSEIDENKDDISDYKNIIKNYKINKKQQKDIKESLNELKWDYNCYNILKVAFGKSGASASVIKESLDEIEEQANEILRKINNGEYRVFFDTIKKSKAGNISDSLDVYIENNRSVRSYESYSGGQRSIINFSVRLALSKILSKLNNVAFGFVALDEVFGSLDEYNKDKMIDVINYLKPLFYQIIVISHTDLKSCFENNIIVEYNKKTGISKIEGIY